MKSGNKTFVVIGLTWLTFFIMAYLETTRYAFINYIIFTILLILFTLWLLILKNTSAQKGQVIQVQHDMQEPPSTEPFAHLTRYDTLTGLPNRIFFNEMLNKAISQAKRHHNILAVLLIDLDHFKDINTKMGRAMGDQTLKEIANRFTKTLRSEDVLAKLDGDEFIVLLNDIGKPKFASAVAEKLLQSCSKNITINSHEFSLTTSIGICIYPNDGSSLEDLLKSADSALYNAKHANGNVYQFYTPEMNIEAQEYIQLESALRNAIKNNELSAYYQPKLDIKNGNIHSVEVLARWNHPTFGMISPEKFIPIAEEAGLIMSMGEWIMREACKTNKYWQDEGYKHMTVAVNLSPMQFYHPDIIKVISSVLNDTGLNPKYLELEINESTVMDNVELATDQLQKIKSTGVQLSIDHFGTGYISINHIKQFPINNIKIDRTFIKGIPNNPNDSAITNAVIALAHNLGLEVVAEGVETAEQVQYLAAHHCDMVQGYYLSHPLPAQKIMLQFKKLTDEAII